MVERTRSVLQENSACGAHRMPADPERAGELGCDGYAPERVPVRGEDIVSATVADPSPATRAGGAWEPVHGSGRRADRAWDGVRCGPHRALHRSVCRLGRAPRARYPETQVCPHSCLDATRCATKLGLGVNAGHDPNLDNLAAFTTIGDIAEVSIGHAPSADALEFGLSTTVRTYLGAVADGNERAAIP